MKKMMTMAFAAIMGMMMSVDAKAVSVAPTNPAEMSVMEDRTSIGEHLESRTMLYTDGEKTNKSVYLIGADGVVRSKTMYRLNKETNEWTPLCVYRAVYGSDDNKIVYASWNESEKAYSNHIIAASYDKSECPVLLRLPDILDY